MLVIAGQSLSFDAFAPVWEKLRLVITYLWDLEKQVTYPEYLVVLMAHKRIATLVKAIQGKKTLLGDLHIRVSTMIPHKISL